MQIVLTEYEAKALIHKALGLDCKLLVKGDLHILQSEHTIHIANCEMVPVDHLGNPVTTGTPPAVQPSTTSSSIPDDYYIVDPPPDLDLDHVTE